MGKDARHTAFAEMTPYQSIFSYNVFKNYNSPPSSPLQHTSSSFPAFVFSTALVAHDVLVSHLCFGFPDLFSPHPTPQIAYSAIFPKGQGILSVLVPAITSMRGTDPLEPRHIQIC